MTHRGFGPDRWGIAVLAGILLASTARAGPSPLAVSLGEQPAAVSLTEAEGERFKRRARLVRVPEEDIEEAVSGQRDIRSLREVAVAFGLIGLSSTLWVALRRRRFLSSV
ncbi:MAG TPA: hypothetical protein PK857_09855 [Hyphomicrobium sp.]|nr:hypothetical protein [Hyphomicrobium sp.]HRO51040.1 hypothetical protein [Hyphomicrobium sp.]